MTQGSINRTSDAGAQQAVKQVVTQKVDSAAMRLVQEAESQAAAIRQQAGRWPQGSNWPAMSKPTR